MSEGREFETWDRNAPASFRAGCFRISRLKDMRMALTHQNDSPSAATIYLFGQKRTRDIEAPQVFLHSYRFPAGRRAFREQLGSYRKQIQAFKLEGGGAFSSGLLSIEQVDSMYVHGAFRVRSGRVVYSIRLDTGGTYCNR